MSHYLSYQKILATPIVEERAPISPCTRDRPQFLQEKKHRDQDGQQLWATPLTVHVSFYLSLQRNLGHLIVGGEAHISHWIWLLDSRLSWFNTVDQKSQGTFGNPKKEKKVKSCFHSSYNPNEVNERKKKGCNFTSAFVISVHFFYPSIENSFRLSTFE